VHTLSWHAPNDWKTTTFLAGPAREGSNALCARRAAAKFFFADVEEARLIVADARLLFLPL